MVRVAEVPCAKYYTSTDIRGLAYRLGYRLPNHMSDEKFTHYCRGSTKMSHQMIFVDSIFFFVGGVLSLSKQFGKIPRSTTTLLVATITEVLTDAHIHHLC